MCCSLLFSRDRAARTFVSVAHKDTATTIKDLFDFSEWNHPNALQLYADSIESKGFKNKFHEIARTIDYSAISVGYKSNNFNQFCCSNWIDRIVYNCFNRQLKTFSAIFKCTPSIVWCSLSEIFTVTSKCCAFRWFHVASTKIYCIRNYQIKRLLTLWISRNYGRPSNSFRWKSSFGF